jgi:Zn-dependent protease/predicted transcriptional regulator
MGANNINLGRILGIPIQLSWTWFLIFVLVTWSLADGYFPAQYPTLSPAVHLIIAAVTSALFFASVLAHELGHAYIAVREGIGVRSITLFIFGGVAQLEEEPRTAGAALRVALAGPVVSVALGLFFGALWLLDQAIPWLAAPSIYLAQLNLILAGFNMIPGYPLDGGRVLQAIVWHFSGDGRRATRMAAMVGQLVAFGFIGLGITVAINGNLFNGLWLAFIGWFLQNAAGAAAGSSRVEEVLEQLSVQQVMRRDWPEVSGRLPLSNLVEDHMLRGTPRYFLVRREGYGITENGDGYPHGMLTATDIMRRPQSSWGRTTAEQVMVPWEKVVTVSPDMSLLLAMRAMDRANVAQVPVVTGGQLVGVLAREGVMHALQVQMEMGKNR